MALTLIGLAGTINKSVLIKVLRDDTDAIKRSKSIYFFRFP